MKSLNLSSFLFDSAAQQQSRSEQLKASLDEAISRYELIKINVLLQQAKAEFSVREYLFQVLIPLMVRVGEAVFHKEFSIGQEHALSAVVKYHLLQVFYLLSNSRAVLGETEAPKTFALATSENNQHEFGLLAAAVLCALQGYAVFYLGTNMPADSLAEAAEAVGANCVILGLAPIEGQNSINTQYIERLLYALPKTCELWTGGSSDYRTPAHEVGRLRHLPSLDELDRLLMNLKQI
ncbi:MAG: hypothetical protein NTX25_09365 [Proteobacteria bacterium]|nr:hypothetical protein [Pseudomonadota bacterium]